MKKKLLFAIGVSMLAIFASGLFAANTWADDDAEDDIDLWQAVTERLGDENYWTYDIDGELEFEDFGILMEQVAEELGVSVGGSGGGGFLDSGACSTTSGVITCTVTTALRYVVVGKREGSSDLIMCECATVDGTYTQTGIEALGSSTALRVYGTSGQDAIKLVRSGTSDVTGCSFDDFPTQFTSQILVQGNGAYDLVYASDDDDTLLGEYVMGYAGVDDIDIESNQPATEYGFGGDDDDDMLGNAGSDQLYGQDNNDLIHGSGGDDLLRGGPDNDVVDGDDGADRIYGDGADPCDDSADADYLYGGADGDTIYAQCGDDHLDGETGTDACHGETENTADYCRYNTCETTSGCESDWT